MKTMVEYTCEICNKKFYHKGNFLRHKNRKNLCKLVYSNYSKMNTKDTQMNKNRTFRTQMNTNIKVKIRCNLCNKSFSNRSSRNRHIKKYCKLKGKKVNNEKLVDSIIQINERLDENDRKNSQIIELYTKHMKQSIINSNINSNNNNTSNITINNYGNEDMSFIKNRQNTNSLFIKNILKQGFKGLQKYIHYKYCNPCSESNLTIKYTNKRHKDIFIRNNNKWVTKNKNEIMDEIYNWDTNVEEVLNIYEHMFDISDEQNMDLLQKNFINDIESVYENKDLEHLDKAKQNTLNQIYDCYVNNKELYDIVLQ